MSDHLLVFFKGEASSAAIVSLFSVTGQMHKGSTKGESLRHSSKLLHHWFAPTVCIIYEAFQMKEIQTSIYITKRGELDRMDQQEAWLQFEINIGRHVYRFFFYKFKYQIYLFNIKI